MHKVKKIHTMKPRKWNERTNKQTGERDSKWLSISSCNDLVLFLHGANTTIEQMKRQNDEIVIKNNKHELWIRRTRDIITWTKKTCTKTLHVIYKYFAPFSENYDFRELCIISMQGSVVENASELSAIVLAQCELVTKYQNKKRERKKKMSKENTNTATDVHVCVCVQMNAQKHWNSHFLIHFTVFHFIDNTLHKLISFSLNVIIRLSLDVLCLLNVHTHAKLRNETLVTEHYQFSTKWMSIFETKLTVIN